MDWLQDLKKKLTTKPSSQLITKYHDINVINAAENIDQSIFTLGLMNNNLAIRPLSNDTKQIKKSFTYIVPFLTKHWVKLLLFGVLSTKLLIAAFYFCRTRITVLYFNYWMKKFSRGKCTDNNSSKSINFLTSINSCMYKYYMQHVKKYFDNKMLQNITLNECEKILYRKYSTNLIILQNSNQLHHQSPHKKSPTSKPPTPKQPTPKPKAPTPKQPTPKQPTPKQPTPKQPTPKQPTPKQPTPKQPTPKQPTPKQQSPKPKAPSPPKKAPSPHIKTPSPKPKAPSPPKKAPSPKLSQAPFKKLNFPSVFLTNLSNLNFHPMSKPPTIKKPITLTTDISSKPLVPVLRATAAVKKRPPLQKKFILNPIAT